jgi:hypothetical protein
MVSANSSPLLKSRRNENDLPKLTQFGQNNEPHQLSRSWVGIEVKYNLLREQKNSKQQAVTISPRKIWHSLACSFDFGIGKSVQR